MPEYLLMKISTDGSSSISEIGPVEPSLESLQSIVGGLIQEVRLDPEWQDILSKQVRVKWSHKAQSMNLGFEETARYVDPITGWNFDVMYANEEGLLLELPFNAPASAMAEQFIVGNVAIIFRTGFSIDAGSTVYD